MSLTTVELGGQRVQVREDSVWTCDGCGKAIRARMERQIAQHRRVCAQLGAALADYRRAQMTRHVLVFEDRDLARFEAWEDEP